MRDNNNAYIFKEYRDKKYFLKVLKEVETEGIIQIAASRIMDNHAHLLMKIIRYVHINPVNAKIIDTRLDYKWSSYSLYVENPEDFNEDIVSWVVNYFQNKQDSFVSLQTIEGHQEYLEIREDLEKYQLNRA